LQAKVKPKILWKEQVPGICQTWLTQELLALGFAIVVVRPLEELIPVSWFNLPQI